MGYGILKRYGDSLYQKLIITKIAMIGQFENSGILSIQ